MPTFNNDVLPATPFENIGSPTQPWNGYFGNINGDVTILFGNSATVYASQPIMILDGSDTTIIEVNMGQDVNQSFWVSNTSPGAFQFILFRIVQDAVGGWKFTWPTNFVGAMLIDNRSYSMPANQILHQMFLFDKNSGYVFAIGVGVLT